MPCIIFFFVFIFGTIVGSFLNVVILRYNTGMKIAGNLFGSRFGSKISNGSPERSVCFSCGKQLSWYELIPVLSFFFQGGKCRGCKTKISWQYPLVEIATGLIFTGIVYLNFSPYYFLNLFSISHLFLKLTVVSILHFVIWSLLVVITVYDFRHKIIPDGPVYAFAVFSFFAGISGVLFHASLETENVAGISSLIGPFLLNHGVAAVAFFVFFGGLWLVSGGRWLGFGDAKLVVGVGLLLGLARGFTALTLAFWIGALVSILILGGQVLYQKAVQVRGLRREATTLTMKSEIPFAPFIILGTLITFFWNFDIFSFVGQLLTF